MVELRLLGDSGVGNGKRGHGDDVLQEYWLEKI
jgi:hypothetical protein